jgi:hypothetical protein
MIRVRNQCAVCQRLLRALYLRWERRSRTSRGLSHLAIAGAVAQFDGDEFDDLLRLDPS